ncbi:hypothetical protein B0H13DRAFT_2276491 [Mycena leptocephala]|nr:hypothetical protein B0H13DRAFT_2276491 [Mycena leptocephala]
MYETSNVASLQLFMTSTYPLSILSYPTGNTAVIFLTDSENHLRMRSSTQSGCALTQSDAPLTLAGVHIGEAWIRLPLES